MVTLSELGAAWNTFFFAPVPAHSIALFRIAFGCVLLFEAFFLLAHAEDYFGPDGLIPYERFEKRARGRAFSLFLYLPPTLSTVYWILAAHIVAVALLTVGLLTPLSAVASFVTLRSLIARNPEIANGGDNVAKYMAFFLMFTPCGAAYSLDARWFSAWASADGSAPTFEPWALRLMQIQLCIVYFNTAYWKLKGATYRNGTAMYYAMTSLNYSRRAFPVVLLQAPFVQALTWGVVAFEFSLGIGLWIEDFRPWLIITGILLHLGIELFLSVHLFGWYMMASLLLFVDPATLLPLGSR